MSKPAPPAETTLHRVAVLRFERAPRQSRMFGFVASGIRFEPIGRADEEGQRHVVVASTELEYFPSVAADGLVVVTSKERRRLESAIETAANLRAIDERMACTVNSPGPRCVFFEPHSDRAREWFEQHAGIHEEGDRMRSLETWRWLDIVAVVNQLTDRLDGVALLAEAIASPPTGAFRDYVRLFERAFRTSVKHLAIPLVSTLDPRMGYTEKEVQEWVAARDPASHADYRQDFVLSADVAPLIARMKQAAYDVVLNKRDWRSPTTERRDILPARAGTGGEKKIFVVQHSTDVVTTTSVLDEFSRYPLDLSAVFRETPRAGWWPPVVPTAPENFETAGMEIEIVDEAEFDAT